MKKRIYEAFFLRVSMTGYQKDQLRLLERCADKHQEETEGYACHKCPKLLPCRRAWDSKCGEGFTIEEANARR